MGAAMNTCTQLRPRLSDYLDRHLDEAGTREMRARRAPTADTSPTISSGCAVQRTALDR